MTNPKRTERANETGLPYGSGSLRKQGKWWWIIWHDPDRRGIQENSHSTDPAVARRLLVERALASAKMRVARIQAVLDETKAETARKNAELIHRLHSGGDQTHDGPQPGGGRGSVRGNPARSSKRDSKKEGRR